MKYLLGFLGVIICFPAVALGQAEAKAKARAPESLLSAEVLAFVRYDGYEPHRKAYDRTTLAKVMKDDLGEFLEYLVEFTRDAILDGIRQDDAKPQQKEKTLAEINKFMEYFWKHGIVVGVEVSDEAPIDLGRVPDFPNQTTIVFPEGGGAKNRAVIFSFLHLLTDLAGSEITEKKAGPRTIFKTADDSVAWWQEGEHVIVRLGTYPVQRTIDVIEGKKPNLTGTPLYQKLAGFKSYETDIRGLVDLEKIVDLVRAPGEKDSRLEMIVEALKRHFILHHLGANGLDGLTFHLGFSGKYQRSTVMLHVAEKKKRTGLLRMLTSAATDPANLALDKLPALPADAANVSVLQLDWVALYDYVIQTTRLIELAQAVSEGRLPDNNNPLLDLDAALGLDFRNDFLASLEPTVVLYNAHSEGPFILGQGVAIKVKDKKKLTECLTTLNKALADSGLGCRFDKRVYRGVDMYVFSGPAEVPIGLTYTVHKDWLVIGAFPQSVKGYILRSEGGRKKWQPPVYYQELLAQCLKEGGPNSRLAGVSVIDPQPNFEIGLALLPVAAKLSHLVQPLPKFDVSKIPNAQAVNEFLYPTVSFYFDDGNTLRWENHFSVDLPVEFMIVPFFLGVLADLF